MSRPRIIPQRRRVFLGCEGESERGYGTLLARLTETRHRRVHIDTVLLQPGGGDPLAIVEKAIRLMRERVARFGPYAVRAILLDDDKRGLKPDRDAAIGVTAARHHIHLIWQTPCHEGLLLRHVEGCHALRPPDARSALAELKHRWPGYRKALPAVQLGERINAEAVVRAARTDAALAVFLDAIEFGRD